MIWETNASRSFNIIGLHKSARVSGGEGGSFWYLYWQVMYTSNSCVREKQRRKSDLRRSRGRALWLWFITVSGFLSQFLNGSKSIFNQQNEFKWGGQIDWLAFYFIPTKLTITQNILRNSCCFYVHPCCLGKKLRVRVRHLTKRPVGKKFWKGEGHVV